MTEGTALPRSFWAVGIALLLWNLIGDAAYLTQVTADLDALARTDPTTAKAFAEMPQWAWGVYATGVWSGTLASILLLLRRRWAFWLFAVSLIAVIVQFTHSFVATDLLKDKGVAAAAFPLVIVSIGGFTLWWTRTCDRLGYLR